MLMIDLHNFNKNPVIQISRNKAKKSFHAQILKAWYTVIDHPPKKVYHILNQYIANNHNIKLKEYLKFQNQPR